MSGFTFPAAGNPSVGLLLDIVEGWNGWSSLTAAAINQSMENRGYTQNLTNQARAGMQIFTAVQTGPTMVIDNAVGLVLANFVSGATNNTRTGGGSPDGIVIPVHQRFAAGVNVIPAGAYSRPLREYTLELPARQLIAGTAIFEHGIGFGNANIPSIGAEPFAIFSSDPATNAGRWRIRYRLVNGGAVLGNVDTGLVPTAWHKFGLRYTEGNPPKLEWLIDEVPIFSLSGDANMITVTNKGQLMAPWQGLTAPAGSTMQVAASRFRVREV
jgi:hypothetical protein